MWAQAGMLSDADINMIGKFYRGGVKVMSSLGSQTRNREESIANCKSFPDVSVLDKIEEVHPMKQVAVMSVVQVLVFGFMLLSFWLMQPRTSVRYEKHYIVYVQSYKLEHV